LNFECGEGPDMLSLTLFTIGEQNLD